MDTKETFTAFTTSLKQQNYSHSTIRNIQKSLNSFGRHLEKKRITDILQINRHDITDYFENIRKTKTTSKTKQAKMLTVKHLFKHLKEKRKIFIDPADNIKLPKKEKQLPRTILTKKEIERLIDAPNINLPEGIRDRTLLELLYSTGIRLGETVKLDIEDISLKNCSLFIREGKGKKDRLIPIGRTTRQWLKNYITKIRPHLTNKRLEDPALFISINGERLSPYWITTIIRDYAKQAEIKKQVTTHVIRHTMASHLLLGGAPIEIVQRILGHENISTTTIYTRVFPVDVKTTHEKTHPRETGVKKVKQKKPCKQQN